MKTIILMTALLLIPPAASAAETAGAAKPKVEVTKSEKQNGLTGLLTELWKKLRRYRPPSMRVEASKHTTAIAGVRGNEATTSTLQPYWKGDRTNDPAYLEEIAAFDTGQTFANNGDFKQAASAFDAFIAAYPESTLKPSAQFALGLAYAGIADKTKGTAALRAFLDDNPKHPLAADADQLIAELKKP